MTSNLGNWNKIIAGLIVFPLALFCYVHSESALVTAVGLALPVTSALTQSIAVLKVCVFSSLLYGLITDNVSSTDRLWSVIPVVFSWIFTASTESTVLTSNAALPLIACITIWGLRLSFNFWRKGGYALSYEDYRWEYVRLKTFQGQKMQSDGSIYHASFTYALLWEVFHLFFVCIFQQVLLWMLSLPVYYASLSNSKVSWLQFALVALVLLLIVTESIADQQQWNFHQRKYSGKKTADKEVNDGFVQSGLFAYSRHPNFICEQSIWVLVAVYGVTVNGMPSQADLYTPAVLLAGAMALMLLFQGSTTLTEEITSAKYPAYKKYQKRVSRLIPWWPSGSS
ncbi:hypothetical protein MIR68_010040 [Amoeboaphelidium protococcarum]|nr:hypothetical protein MIR68_010040 [Amoeboaphelidium protococcarum]